MIKSFNLRYVIHYSYPLCDFSLYILWLFYMGVHSPLLLLKNPTKALSAPDIQIIVHFIRDTYLNHVCYHHSNILSPCDCREPINKTVRALFPLSSFDPLHINNVEVQKNTSIMVATIILTIALIDLILIICCFILSIYLTKQGIHSNRRKP